jgi:hypothetical protein
VDTATAKDLDALSDALKALKPRLKSGKAASAEARQVIVVGDRIGASLSDAAIPESVRIVWAPANRQLDTIAQAFGIQRAGVTVQREVAPAAVAP